VITTQNSFRIKGPKARHVIGLDEMNAFINGNKSRQLRAHVRAIKTDFCHVLALETNGTVFRLKALDNRQK